MVLSGDEIELTDQKNRLIKHDHLVENAYYAIYYYDV